MKGYISGRSASATGPVEWLKANLNFRESSCFEFLSSAGPSLGVLKAIVRRYETKTRNDQPPIERYDGVFNAAITPGISTEVPPWQIGPFWPSPGMAVYPSGSGSLPQGGIIGTQSVEPETETVRVLPGQPLPLASDLFDSVTVGPSVGHVHDLASMLREAYRILRPEGMLRLEHEMTGECFDLIGKRFWISQGRNDAVRIVVCEASSGDCIRHYGLLLDISRQELESILGTRDLAKPGLSLLTQEVLDALRRKVTDAAVWDAEHPSVRRVIRGLCDAGFRRTGMGSTFDDILGRLFGWGSSRKSKRRKDSDSAKRETREEALITADIPAGFPRGDVSWSIRGVK